MRRKAAPRTSWLMYAAGAGFLAGVAVTAAIRPMAPPRPPAAATVEVQPAMTETPPPVAPPAPTPATAPPMIVGGPDRRTAATRPGAASRSISAGDIHDDFNQLRGSNRRHEAIDVLAPRHTPVLAVEDGTVAKLFLSEAGGITLYQFDPTDSYVYYYAHLEGYAPGLKEKDAISRGQVIGYVGTTGNAPRDTPHLHFAIFKMSGEKQWWRGTAIDPYQVYR